MHYSEQVGFDMNRVDHTLAVRYTNRLRVDDCVFIGGGVFIAGPTRDVRVERWVLRSRMNSSYKMKFILND